MHYDCLIIGGGIAGLTCGITLMRQGRTCAIFSAGMSALHFSSGSIDLLGHYPDRQVVTTPFSTLPEFLDSHPDHPYNRCGLEAITQSLTFFRNELTAQGLELYANGQENHFHVTALGTIKPTYLSQRSVFNEKIKEAYLARPSIAILNFEGFRDFYPALAAANLAKHVLFQGCQITTGVIRLPEFFCQGRARQQLRSIDIGRLFEQAELLNHMAELILQVAGSATMVGLPAFIGLGQYQQALSVLHEKTGRLIYEVPTLPPSILGMRLDDALKSRFAELGGVLITGDKVIAGRISAGRIDHIHTRHNGWERLKADNYVLASGSFFSGGLTSHIDTMQEPIFDLTLDYDHNRGAWSAKRFFDPASHPFLSYGVKTDEHLRPYDRNGRLVENLYCVGAVLAHYDPILEGSGAGVAIATGYKAAMEILAHD